MPVTRSTSARSTLSQTIHPYQLTRCPPSWPIHASMMLKINYISIHVDALVVELSLGELGVPPSSASGNNWATSIGYFGCRLARCAWSFLFLKLAVLLYDDDFGKQRSGVQIRFTVTFTVSIPNV